MPRIEISPMSTKTPTPTSAGLAGSTATRTSGRTAVAPRGRRRIGRACSAAGRTTMSRVRRETEPSVAVPRSSQERRGGVGRREEAAGGAGGGEGGKGALDGKGVVVDVGWVGGGVVRGGGWAGGRGWGVWVEVGPVTEH